MVPLLVSNTRLLLFPEIVTAFGRAEPSIVRLWFSSNSPPVSVMVWPERLESKVMVEPLAAVAITWRNEPEPLSLVVVTTFCAKAATVVASKIQQARGVFRWLPVCYRQPSERVLTRLTSYLFLALDRRRFHKRALCAFECQWFY